jgi:hypothetical protein
MYSGQVATMAEASLPLPPTTEEFFGALEKVVTPVEDTTGKNDDLFGDLFDEEEEGNVHTKQNFQVGMRAVQDFAGVLHAKGKSYSALDVWLVKFSQWILAPEALFDDPSKIEQCKEERRQMAEDAGVPVRSWCPNTLKTQVNVLALKYRETFAAAPAEEGAAANVKFEDTPFPFKKLEVVTTEVKVEGDPCAKCGDKLGTRGTIRPVFCDLCKEYWHLKCAGLSMPPRWGSWACPRCDG